ncbi:MAG: hypothetical protein ACAH80_02320 [Alphaproteobacteria bacterium]
MPDILKIEFKSKEAQVSALELKIYRGDELTNHGAPDSLIVRKGDKADYKFWDNMRALNNALNATPDTYPLRQPEIKVTPKKGAADVFNDAGRHVLAGGDDAYIDTIRRQDLPTVATKALRELRAMNLISEGDYKDGLRTLESFGMPAAESYFRDHRAFRKGTEGTPTAPKP